MGFGVGTWLKTAWGWIWWWNYVARDVIQELSRFSIQALSSAFFLLIFFFRRHLQVYSSAVLEHEIDDFTG
jgi:hypothetical protein